MWTLARKILLHDRVKFAVASAGVSISVMMVLVQIGLYGGFMDTASTVIDHSSADIWVASKGSESFDFPARIDDRTYYRVASTPGVARAERMLNREKVKRVQAAIVERYPALVEIPSCKLLLDLVAKPCTDTVRPEAMRWDAVEKALFSAERDRTCGVTTVDEFRQTRLLAGCD